MADTKTNRRRFLGFFTSLLMAVIGLLVAIPAVGYFLAPLRRKLGRTGDGYYDVGPLADVPIGEWRLLALEMVREDGWKQTRVRHSVWVRRNREGEGDQDITVLSTICPHLGCPINWLPDQSQFNCPCHGGIFDADGQKTGGPPPRRLDELQKQVRAGQLWVRWQDFKIGVAESVPVNV